MGAKDTELKIKEAAKSLFIEQGYEKTGSREICKQAGVQLSLLNYYFGTKEHLFHVIICELFDEFFKSLYDILDNPQTSFYEKIDHFCNAFSHFLMSNEKMFTLIQKEVETVKLEIFKDAQEKMQKYKGKVNFTKTVFAQQYLDVTKKSIQDFQLFLMHFLSVLIYPLQAIPLFSLIFEASDSNITTWIQSRKPYLQALIPHLL